MGLPPWACVEKTIHELETLRLSGKSKVLGIVVSKDGHADSLLEHENTLYYLFSWKMCNCKPYFLLTTPLVKFTLFIEWPL